MKRVIDTPRACKERCYEKSVGHVVVPVSLPSRTMHPHGGAVPGASYIHLSKRVTNEPELLNWPPPVVHCTPIQKFVLVCSWFIARPTVYTHMYTPAARRGLELALDWPWIGLELALSWP